MAREHCLLTLIFCVSFGVALAQEPPPSDPKPPSPSEEMGPPPPDQPGRDPRRPKFGGENGERPGGPKDERRMREMRERLEKMSPEERKKAMEKLRRWEEMPGDEKAHFRFMQAERDRRTREAVEAAVKASGLELTPEQRKIFSEVYREERRKLEEELRKEMDAKREARFPELNQKVIDLYKKQAIEPKATPSVSAATPSAT